MAVPPQGLLTAQEEYDGLISPTEIRDMLRSKTELQDMLASILPSRLEPVESDADVAVEPVEIHDNPPHHLLEPTASYGKADGDIKTDPLGTVLQKKHDRQAACSSSVSVQSSASTEATDRRLASTKPITYEALAQHIRSGLDVLDSDSEDDSRASSSVGDENVRSESVPRLPFSPSGRSKQIESSAPPCGKAALAEAVSDALFGSAQVSSPSTVFSATPLSSIEDVSSQDEMLAHSPNAYWTEESFSGCAVDLQAKMEPALGKPFEAWPLCECCYNLFKSEDQKHYVRTELARIRVERQGLEIQMRTIAGVLCATSNREDAIDRKGTLELASARALPEPCAGCQSTGSCELGAIIRGVSLTSAQEEADPELHQLIIESKQEEVILRVQRAQLSQALEELHAGTASFETYFKHSPPLSFRAWFDTAERCQT